MTALTRVLLVALLSVSLTGAVWSQEREREGARPEAIIRGLLQGVEALQALGRHEEAERLRQIAEQVREPRREGERGERERAGEGERPPTEREVALQQLETMRIALPALLEAGRRDSAELLERAIRAREVALERRNDEEAREIRERAPTLGNQVELLGFASRLWREFGNEDKARRVGALAERFQQHLRRQRAGGEREEEAAEGQRGERERARELAERERAEDERAARERAERERRERPETRPVSAQVKELQHKVAELEAALREVRERLERREQAQRGR